MKPAYPELQESIERVARIVRDEENRYATTFQVAERFFQDEAKSAAGGVLPGAAAFKLYDTYGLALDEQEEMAREFGLHIDREGFTAEMEKQRARARASWKGADKAQMWRLYIKNCRPSNSSAATRWKRRSKSRNSSLTRMPWILVESGDAEVVFTTTPFYAESGGQTGDTGLLLNSETRETVAVVTGAYKPAPSAMVQRIRVLQPFA